MAQDDRNAACHSALFDVLQHQRFTRVANCHEQVSEFRACSVKEAESQQPRNSPVRVAWLTARPSLSNMKRTRFAVPAWSVTEPLSQSETAHITRPKAGQLLARGERTFVQVNADRLVNIAWQVLSYNSPS